MDNYYIIDDLQARMFSERPKIKAKSPKEATEKVLNCKVKRVTTGGNIVVYNCHTCRTYVYKRI